MSFNKKAVKPQFYRLDAIDEKDTLYNMIIGERSNGKTFAVLERIIKRYISTEGY